MSKNKKHRKPDPADATLVPPPPVSPPEKTPPQDEEVTLVPPTRPDATNDSRVRLNELLDRFESEEHARTSASKSPTANPRPEDPDEVQLTPDRKSEPSTDSRLRLHQLLDRDDPGAVEATLAPSISVDASRSKSPPEPSAVDQTLVRPESVVASVAQKIAARVGKKPSLSGSTVAHTPMEPTLVHESVPKPTVEMSATEVEATRVPAVESMAPENELTRSMTTNRTANEGINRVPAGDRGAGRYAVKSLHARGGLGEVYTATDTELNREVALKRIQSKYADDPSSRRRFLTEAEITARLDHPGVVPVFGLVADGNGRPCYAMRFIRGESLRDEIHRFYRKPEGQAQPSDKTVPDGQTAPAPSAVPSSQGPESDERRLAFRQLLQRFIAVCQAIAYAHTRSVIHRDIKPANVMVGSFGETLVVDWGLAKVLGESADADDPLREAVHGNAGRAPDATVAADVTSMGTAVGTPAYMAPEQAAGRVDIVGPPADIYSLGATLYYILTGQAPFSGTNASETIRKVQLGEFVPSSTVNPNAPKALDAVCRKAMSTRIEDRYATALELAADIEKWLSDEPVSCYPDPWHANLGRWARRNPARVAASVSLLLTGLIATAAILFVVSGAKEEKERQLRQTEEARAKAISEQERAEGAEKATRHALIQVQASELQTQKALEKATAAQQLASKRFSLAQSAFSLLVNDIQNELADRAGTQALREKLLLKARQGLEDVIKTAEEDKEADPTGADQLLFWARFQMGDVYRGMARTGEARTEFEQAAIVAERRVKASRPNDPNARNDFARANDMRALVALQTGNSSAALEFNDASLAEWRKLNAEKPGSVQKELAACLDNRAAVLLERGKTTDAHTASLEALGIRKDLAKPGDTAAARDHARSLEREADILLRLGNSADAIAKATEAVDARRAVANEVADRTDVRLDLAASLTRRGDIYHERSELEKARTDYDEALKTLNDTLEKDPNSVGAKTQKAAVLSKISRVQLKLGREKEGLESARNALVMSAELAKDDRESAEARRELAAGHERLGEAYLANALPRKALEEFRTGKDLLESLARNDAKSSRAKSDVARLLEFSGQAELDDGDPVAAASSLAEAVEMRRAIAKTDAESADTLRSLAASLDRLANARLQANETSEATSAAEECLGIYRKALNLDPQSRRARRDLAGAYARWGEVVDRQGKPTAALILLHDSTDVFGKLQAEDASDVTAKEDRAAGLEKLATVYKNAGLGPARVDAESEAWRLREQVLNVNPNSLIARRAMMTSTRRIGDIKLEDRNLPEARKWFARAAALPDKFGDDPIFAREKEIVSERQALCDAIEKGQKSPAALAAYPLRLRSPALVAILEPGREGSVSFTDSAGRLLAEVAKERETFYRDGLSQFGLDSLAGTAARDREEMYYVGRAFASCAARSTNADHRAQYARAAIAYLAEAHRLGFRDADRVRMDWVWGALKDEADFPPDLRPKEAKPQPK